MPAKKKSTSKSSIQKMARGGKSRSLRRKSAAKKSAKSAVAKRKASTKKATTKIKAAVGKRTTVTKTAKRKVNRSRQGSDRAFPQRIPAADYAEQAGDLQGLSRRERSDSESVDELVEEGNAFEADAVAGVEEAEDTDEREVHTREVPEDDVPEEYLDKDIG